MVRPEVLSLVDITILHRVRLVSLIYLGNAGAVKFLIFVKPPLSSPPLPPAIIHLHLGRKQLKLNSD